MATKARFLSENIFNDIMFPTFTVSATEAAAGNEAWRVGTGRRLSLRNKWTPTTLNLEASIKCRTGASTLCDMIALDRGHNLAGQTIVLERSANDFVATTQVFSITVPSATVTDDDLQATPGVRTEEGAWVYAFTGATDQDWRLRIPAMGANLKPEIVGLYLGRSYEPLYHLDLPFEDDDGETFFDSVMSDTAWSAATRAAHRRTGAITLKLASEAEYTTNGARTHILENLMRDRRPTWFCPNQEQAEKTLLIRHAGGRYGFPRRQGWAHRQSTFRWVEHQPLQQAAS